MSTKERVEAASEAAESVIEIEIKKAQIREAEQKKKEKLLSQTYRMIGRIETADLFGKLATVSSLIWLKEVKESQIYLDFPTIGSWETFCNHLGKSRRQIDRDLENLKVFGAEFLQTVSSFKLGYKDLKKLQGSVKNGDMIIEGEYVVIGEEKIPLTPDHKEDLEAAFEVLIEDRDRKIEESKTKLSAKDRVLKAKQKVIQDQEKELAMFTKKIKERDYKPGEEEYIKQLENQKQIITGIFMLLDPDEMTEDTTPLMTAKYIEVLAYIKRMAHAYYDTALETRAQPDDIGWTQPGLNDMSIPSSGEIAKQAQTMRLVGDK